MNKIVSANVLVNNGSKRPIPQISVYALLIVSNFVNTYGTADLSE